VSILEKIVQVKREDTVNNREYYDLLKRDFAYKKVKNTGFFYSSIQKPGLSIIAEYKRSSPSEGVISQKKSPAQQAGYYRTGGASAVSVLTDMAFFNGSNEDLLAVKSSVSLPVLRKDFIIDEGQIYESFFLGADAVLLIAEILDYEQLKDFLRIINEAGMDALVEVISAGELDKALKAGAQIIGINNRNLETFEIDMNLALFLKDKVPEGILTVSESGITEKCQFQAVREMGFNGVLIGTSLMRSSNPAEYLLHLSSREE